jgi:PadR family transcriptional regulator PadR
MSKGVNLGEFEYLVLLAVLRLADDAYGMTVRRELSETAGREAGIGSVYQTLERLERKGLARSRSAPPDPVRGGRPRRFYAVSPEGSVAAAAMRDTASRMWEGIGPSVELLRADE